MLGYSCADFMGYRGGEALQMCRSVSPGAEYCCVLTAWLGLVVPHLEQPGCISSFVSGLLSKGDQGAEKGALFPGLIPEGSWETVKAQPRGGPVELTIPLRRHGFHEQCSWHGAGSHAWHFTQISSSFALWHCSFPSPPLPWSMDVTLVLWDAQSRSSNGYFLLFRAYVWGKQAGVTEVLLCSPPSLPLVCVLCSQTQALTFSHKCCSTWALGASGSKEAWLWEEVVNGWHKVSEESWKCIQTSRSFLFPWFPLGGRGSNRIHIMHKIRDTFVLRSISARVSGRGGSWRPQWCLHVCEVCEVTAHTTAPLAVTIACSAKRSFSLLL